MYACYTEHQARCVSFTGVKIYSLSLSFSLFLSLFRNLSLSVKLYVLICHMNHELPPLRLLMFGVIMLISSI
jgi:hypothetical protein